MPSHDRPVEVSAFAAAVVEVLAASRPGEVLTYGEVAHEAGWPGAARAVGRVLRDHGGELPWWRVVTASGRLVPGNEREHAARLGAEGVATDRGRVVGLRGADGGGRSGPGPAASAERDFDMRPAHEPGIDGR